LPSGKDARSEEIAKSENNLNESKGVSGGKSNGMARMFQGFRVSRFLSDQRLNLPMTYSNRERTTLSKMEVASGK
jgi:hypothetical protein